MTTLELKALVEKLQNENLVLAQKVAARKPKKAIKVSAKGAVSIYGLGRFPVTLYKQQMLALLDMGEEIRAFIEAHEAELKVKDAA